MINQRMFALGNEPSAIRELFSYGLVRKAEIGAENVFDFSIGNPSVPAPDAVRTAVLELIEQPPCELHGYTPASGAASVRQTVADSIRRRFDVPATPGNIYLTAGAAAGLAITISALTEPGDEIIVSTPFFPEYSVWVGTAGCKLVEVPSLVPSFQIDVEAVRGAINERTSAIIVNSPNNPTGAVYTRETLEALAEMLREKEAELGRKIYIICDEPYREITYGAEVPYIPAIYDRTVVCYSYSKSLSLPGERIGYVYVSDLMEEAADVSFAVAGAGRALGFICAPALFQRVIEKCIDEPSDVEAYRANRKLLCDGLDEFGYEYVQPDGAFYLWVRALEEDAEAFCERAKDYELLIVPSNSFGCGGWVRISYCVAPEVISASLPAFKALAESYRK